MSIEQQGTSTFTSIHPDTSVGMVSLRVSDLERARRFYEGVIGFQPLEQTPEGVILGGQEKRPLLELLAVPGATSQSRRATGLYHVAILLPTRPDLGRAFLRLARAGVQIGQGDHLVSEALYISDPDGNGLELYRDRPRNTWHWTNDMVEMAVDPVDTRSLAEEGARDAEPWETLPVGTRVGHIHLQVAAIPAAEHFYHTILGFDITASMPGALFVSAGGYHHHIGLNTWHSQGGRPTPATQAGLQRYTLAIPTREALVAVKERLLAHKIPFAEQGGSIRINDPWSNEILLTVLPW
ncbi:MAG: VOC family protein [Ktedonobacteraceae bacterium]